MSTSTVLSPTSPLPLSPPTTHDPALKPNPHPYAIKTTHTALLSRSNSSGHNTPSRHFYSPSTGTSSRSPTKRAHEYRGHRQSNSLTGELPFPLPSPLPSPTHPQRSEPEGDASHRRPRADTLPTYLADSNHVLSMEPKEDLPLNPKTWTPSQLSVYLTMALSVRSGERLPERVASDIASWVRCESVTGRTFLRWTDQDLGLLGVNVLWRSALLAASRNLRQNILRGRIWGNSVSDEQGQDRERELDDAPFTSALYASSSSSLDLPLTGEDAESGSEHRPTRRLRVSKNANGHVRGMVDKWERESAGSQSPTRSLGANGPNRYGSESDSGSEFGEEEMAAAMGVDAHVSPFPSNGATSVPAEDDEPSIEDLLAAATSPSAPKDGSWGARAWEGLDAGITMRRIEPYDTVVPRRDGSGGSSGADAGSTANSAERRKRRGGNSSSSRCMGEATNKEDPRLARPTVADIFAETPETISTSAHAEAEVQADVRAEMELEEEAAAVAAIEAELEAKELALEDEARATRALMEEFKRRLEEVEARVSAMEADWHPPDKQQAPISQQQQQQSEAREASTDGKDTHDDAPEALPKTVGVTPEPAEEPADEREVGARNAVENGLVEPNAVAERRVAPVRHGMVDLGPTTMSDLPSYVLLVGLGMCAVVLQVVLKRVGGRSLRS